MSLHHVNDPEDGFGINPLPSVDVIADSLDYAPMSPEDQNYARTSAADQMSEQSLARIQRSESQQKVLQPVPNYGMPDPEFDQCVCSNSCHGNGSISLHHVNDSEDRVSIIPLPHVDATGKTLSYAPMSPEDQDYARISDVDPMSEQSQVKIQRSRSQQKALQPVPKYGMLDQECEKCVSRNRCHQDKFILPHHVDDSKDVDIIPPPHVDVSMGTLKYTPTSPEDQHCSKFSDSNPKPEQSLLTIQRSRSRQKALEIRSSAKGSCKRSSGINRDSSVSKTSRDDEQLDSRNNSLKVLKLPTLPTNINAKDRVFMGNCLEEEKSDACGFPLTSSAEDEAKEVQVGNISKIEKSNSVYMGRVTRSRSCGISSGINICRYDDAHEGLKESSEPVKSSVFSFEICSKNEGGIKAEKFRSGAMTETEDHRSRSDNDVSVKPKQLDFTELVDIPSVLGTRSNDTLRQRINDIDGSWPCYKRRKIDYQNFNKSAFPSLGLKPINASRQDIGNKSVRGDKNDSAMFENIVPSHCSDAKLSESTPDKESSLPLPQNLIQTLNLDLKSANYCDLAEQIDHRCCTADMDADLAPAKDNSPMNSSLHDSDAMLSNCEIFPDRTHLRIKSSLDKRVQAALGNVEFGPSSRDPTISLSSDGMLFDCEILCKEIDQTASHVLNSYPEIKHQEGGDKFKGSLASPLIERMNVTEADQAMPEFEGFGALDFGDELFYKENPLLSNIMNRTSLPDICISASSSTSVSPYPAPSKLHLNPNLYSSVPNGLLKNMDWGSNLLPEGGVVQGKSRSDLFPFPRIQRGCDVRRPFLSPVGKGLESITSKSGGSDKVGSGNPELACFTILEDPESCEEDLIEVAEVSVIGTYFSEKSSPIREPLSEDLNEVAGASVTETVSSKKSSSIREPLCDITQQSETIGPSHLVERSSSESVSTEIGVSEMQNIDSKGNVMEHRRSRRTVNGKENKGLSVGGNSHTKHSKALSSRFSKPKLSRNSSLRSRGQSVSEKEPKRNNIVSNVKSFVPLVQLKQAAVAAPVKRGENKGSGGSRGCQTSCRKERK